MLRFPSKSKTKIHLLPVKTHLLLAFNETAAMLCEDRAFRITWPSSNTILSQVISCSGDVP